MIVTTFSYATDESHTMAVDHGDVKIEVGGVVVAILDRGGYADIRVDPINRNWIDALNVRGFYAHHLQAKIEVEGVRSATPTPPEDAITTANLDARAALEESEAELRSAYGDR